jgi:conjugative relaxase-like TrwC/TraI family protein
VAPRATFGEAGEVLTAKKLTRLGGLWGYLKHGGGDREHGPGEYYLGQGRPHETWGQGAGRLGLERLDAEAFDRLARGLHPATGERLIQTQGGGHVPGVDMVFSPPKSVSEALIDATPAERAALEDAHLAAVRAGMGLLQERACVTRPTLDGKVTRTPGELVAGLFTHHTARPTAETVADDRPPDVQLHTHGFVFSMAWSHGRWRAVDSYGLYRTRALAEAAYRVELADRLRQRGWELEVRTTRGGRQELELAGSDPRARELLSSRHREIERAAWRFERRYHRPPTKLERWRLAHDDRLPKDRAHEQAPDWPAYARALDAHGLSRHHLHARPVQPQAPLAEREAVVRAALLAPDGLTREDAIFHRNDVPIRVLEASVGQLSLAEALDFTERFQAGRDLVVVDDARGYLTTQANLDREAAVLAAARTKLDEQPIAPAAAQLERAVARVEQAMSDRAGRALFLTGEQRSALEHLTDRDRGMALLLGHAGTGKTTLLHAATDAFHQAGGRVVVVSTSGDTAQRTGAGVAADQAMTIEAFTAAVDRGRIWPSAALVVMVDEAVMVDTPRMAALLEAAGPARVIAVGDPEQYQAIGAGGWWLEADRALGHAELREVLRQRNAEDRAALADLRAGRAADALANLNARGRVHVVPRQADAVREMVYAWDVHRGEVGTAQVVMVTDASNQVIDGLNRAAQARRLDAGELGPLGLAVHDPDERRREVLHAGDRVAFMQTHRAGGLQVRNGVRGQVLEVDQAARTMLIRTDDGRTVTVDAPEQGPQTLRLAYAAHAIRAQGAEAEVALVLPGAAYAHRQAAYPMLSRGTGEVHVFIDREHHGVAGRDPVEALAERWSISAAKRTATAHLEARERLAGERDTAEREACTSRVWEVPEATWGGRTADHVHERTR